MTNTAGIWSRKLKIFGIGMCFLGVLAVAGGIIAATALQFIQIEECAGTDARKDEAGRQVKGDDLSRAASNGQRPVEQPKTSAEACKEAQENMTVASFLIIAVFGAIGVIVAVLGVFVFFMARTTVDG